jgi:putative endonuclease|tara:strand:- start:3441 stop:3815 length:375 start_codon:yes stop_codon:yes gene_type:complete
MAFHNLLGEEGEKIAVKFLKSKGYIIYQTNWRFGKLEIDIIAEDGKELVFIEVKTRSSEGYGRPEESVDDKKELSLLNAADIYVRDFNLEIEVRFDIISLIINEKKTSIKHIIDAFSGIDQAYY